MTNQHHSESPQPTNTRNHHRQLIQIALALGFGRALHAAESSSLIAAFFGGTEANSAEIQKPVLQTPVARASAATPIPANEALAAENQAKTNDKAQAQAAEKTGDKTESQTTDAADAEAKQITSAGTAQLVTPQKPVADEAPNANGEDSDADELESGSESRETLQGNGRGDYLIANSNAVENEAATGNVGGGTVSVTTPSPASSTTIGPARAENVITQVFDQPAPTVEEDTIGAGEDTVDAGGEDTIDDGGEDTVGAGEDTVDVGGEDTVDAGEDTIDGSGEDTVGAGEDTVDAGGEDTIDDGEDTVNAGGEDTVIAGGEDTVDAGGEDTIDAGEDTVNVGGEDTIDAGEDTVNAGGEDTVIAGGEDTVDAGGEDTIDAGEDTVNAGGEDTVDAGEDTVDTGGEDTVAPEEALNLTGTRGNDSLVGGTLADTLSGGADDGAYDFLDSYFTSSVDNKASEIYGDRIYLKDIEQVGDTVTVDPNSLKNNQLAFLGRLEDGSAIFRLNNGGEEAVTWQLNQTKGSDSFTVKIAANSAVVINVGKVENGTGYKLSGDDAPKTTASASSKSIDMENDGVDFDHVIVGDILKGGAGKDEFHFGQGDGVDLILDFEAGDKLVLTGIKLQDVQGIGTENLTIWNAEKDAFEGVTTQTALGGNGHIWQVGDIEIM